MNTTLATTHDFIPSLQAQKAPGYPGAFCACREILPCLTSSGSARTVERYAYTHLFNWMAYLNFILGRIYSHFPVVCIQLLEQALRQAHYVLKIQAAIHRATI